MKNKFYLITVLLLLIIQSCSTSEKINKSVDFKIPKNVILFISDGCGFNHVNAASLYQFGKKGEQIYENFPVKLAMSTYCVNGLEYNPDSAWTNFNWVRKKPTDSAGSGSSIATGEKTYKGVLSVDTLKNPLETIVDKFEKSGKSTGVISTVPFSNATPAAFVAHNNNRQNYQEIAEEMILKSKVDVIMGGGHPFYNPSGKLVSEFADRFIGSKEIWDMNNGGKPISNEDGKLIPESKFRYVGGKNTWDMLSNGTAGIDSDGDGIADPWTLIQDRESFQGYMKGETPKRLIGIFKSGQASQIERDTTNESWVPFSVPFIQSIPTLKEMTLSAINVLDENKNGFFLMAEGGAVDWAAHSNLLSRTIEEQIDFNFAVEAACKWVEENSSWSETLVIVTADHETGYLFGPNSNLNNTKNNFEKWKPIIGKGRGNMPDVKWLSTHHTNSLVPFYAKGNGSKIFLEKIIGEDPVYGNYIDNTAIGKIIKTF